MFGNRQKKTQNTLAQLAVCKGNCEYCSHSEHVTICPQDKKAALKCGLVEGESVYTFIPSILHSKTIAFLIKEAV